MPFVCQPVRTYWGLGPFVGPPGLFGPVGEGGWGARARVKGMLLGLLRIAILVIGMFMQWELAA